MDREQVGSWWAAYKMTQAVRGGVRLAAEELSMRKSLLLAMAKDGATWNG